MILVGKSDNLIYVRAVCEQCMSVSEPCANVCVDVCELALCVCGWVGGWVCISINTKQENKHTKMSCFEHFILNTLTWKPVGF